MIIPSLFAQNVAIVSNNNGDQSTGSLGYAVTELNALGSGYIDFFYSPNDPITLTQPLPALTQNITIAGQAFTILGQAAATVEFLFQDNMTLQTGLQLGAIPSLGTGIDSSVTAATWVVSSSQSFGLSGGDAGITSTSSGTNITGFGGGNGLVTVGTLTLGSSSVGSITGGTGGSVTDISGTNDQGGSGGIALLTGNSVTLTNGAILQMTGGLGGGAIDNGTGTPTGGSGGEVSVSITSFIGLPGSYSYLNGGHGGYGSTGGSGGFVIATIGDINLNQSGINLQGSAGNGGTLSSGASGSVSLSFNTLEETGGAVINAFGGNGSFGTASASDGGSAQVFGSAASISGSNLYLTGGTGGNLGSTSSTQGGNGGNVSLSLYSFSGDTSSFISLTGGSGGTGGSQSAGGQGGIGGSVGFNAGSVTLDSSSTFNILCGKGGNGSNEGNGGAGGSAWVTLSSLTLGSNAFVNVTTGGGGAGGSGGSQGVEGTYSIAITNLYGTGTLNLTGSNSSFLQLNNGLFNGSINDANLYQPSGSITLNGNTVLSAGATFNGALYGSANITGTNLQVINGIFSGILNDSNFEVAPSGFFTLNGTATNSTGALLNGSLILGSTKGLGYLQGPVSIASGGALLGYGTVNGTVTNSGTLIPYGTSPQSTLTFSQLIQTSSGTLSPQILPGNQSGCLEITTGAQLNGNLDPSVIAGNYGFRDRYLILSGAPVTGTFSQVQISLPNMAETVLYGSNSVSLIIYQNHAAFATYAQNTNEVAVASVLDASLLTASDSLAAKMGEVSNLPSGQAGALDQMGGVIYTALPEALLNQAQYEDGLIFNHTGSIAYAGPNLARLTQPDGSFPGKSQDSLSNPGGKNPSSATSVQDFSPEGLWLETTGSFGSSGPTSQVSGFNISNYGLVGGYDWNPQPGFSLGLLAGYLQSTVQPADLSAKADITGAQFGFYGRGALDNFALSFLGAYVSNHSNVTRSVNLGTDANSLTGVYGGDQIQAALQMDLRLSDAGSTFRPFCGFLYAHLDESAFSETGSDSLALSLPALSYDSFRAYAGLEETWNFVLGKHSQLSPILHVTASRDLAALNPAFQTAFNGAPENTFQITGIVPDGTDFGVGGGLNLTFGSIWDLFADFDGHFTSTGNLSTILGGMSLDL